MIFPANFLWISSRHKMRAASCALLAAAAALRPAAAEQTVVVWGKNHFGQLGLEKGTSDLEYPQVRLDPTQTVQNHKAVTGEVQCL